MMGCCLAQQEDALLLCTVHERQHERQMARHKAQGTEAVSRDKAQGQFSETIKQDKKRDTTALKVPGRSLSRVLVEPNPV